MDYSFSLHLHDLLDDLRDFHDPREEYELIQLNQECLNGLNRSPKRWVAGPQPSQLHNQQIQLYFDILSQQPVSLLVRGHINPNCNTKRLLFNHLMHVLQDLYDLRHDDDLLYDLLKDVRHLHQPLLVSDDGNGDVDYSINDLKHLLDVVDVTDYFFELFKNHSSLDYPFHFLHCFVLVPHLDNLLVLLHDLLDPLHDDWNLNDLLYDVLDVSVYIDQLWYDSFDLYDPGNLNKFLLQSLHLVDLRHYDCLLYYFLDDLLGGDDLLNCSMHRHYFFSQHFDLLDLISDVRHFLNDLSDLGIDHYSFLNPSELYRLWLDGVLDNDLLDNCWDLYDLLDGLGYWYKLLNDSVNWHLYLYRHDELPLHLNNLGHFYAIVNDLLNRDVPWHFLDHLNNPLLDELMIYDLLLGSLQLDQLIHYSFYEFLHLYVDVLFNDDFLDPFLDDWDLNDFLYLFDPFFDHDLRYDSLNDLDHFNDLLNYSRHHYDPFYDFFNLYNLRHFDHLLDDLLNRHLDFLNPVDMPQNFHDFLLDVFDRLGDFDVVIDYFFDLHDLDLSDDDGLSDLDDDWHLSFDGLNHWFFDNFLHPDDALMDDWHLNDPFYLLRHFSNNLNDPFYDLLDLFDDLPLNNLLSDDLDLNGHLNSVGHLNDLFDDLRHLDDPFFPLDDDHRFLYNPIDDDMSDFNMIFYFFGSHDLDFLHDLLYDSLHLNDLRHSNDLLHDFLDKDRHLDQPLYDLLNMNDLLLDDLDLTDLNGHMVDNLSNWNHLLHLNDLFYVFFHYLYLRDFFDDLDDAVDYGWHFDCLLYDPLHMDDLFVDSGDNEWYLDGDWNVLLNFSDFLHLDDLLYYLLDHDYLWDFYDPINDLLDDLLDLDDLSRDAEHLQNVINVHNSHDLLIDQPDHTLIDLQSFACPSLDLLQLLEQCLEQHSEMELHLSGLLRGVGIDIIDLYNFRHYLNDFYNAFKLISLNHIDQILLEELVKSNIAFLLQLWVLVHVFLHLGGQHMDQVLSTGILGGDLYELVPSLGQIHNSTDDGHLQAFTTEELVQSGLVLELDSGGFQFIHLGFEETAETHHLSSQLAVLLLNGSIVNSSDGQLFNLRLRDTGIIDSLKSQVQSGDFTLQIPFSLGRSSQPLLEVLDLLLKFHHLILFLIDQQIVIQDSTCGIGGGEADFSFEQAVDLRLQEVDSLAKLFSLVSAQ